MSRGINKSIKFAFYVAVTNGVIAGAAGYYAGDFSIGTGLGTALSSVFTAVAGGVSLGLAGSALAKRITGGKADIENGPFEAKLASIGASAGYVAGAIAGPLICIF